MVNGQYKSLIANVYIANMINGQLTLHFYVNASIPFITNATEFAPLSEHNKWY